MRTLLRINGERILNFMDLRENFSPAELYGQLADFRRFAAVHCVPLGICYTDSDTQELYIARYVTKEFWYSLLGRSQWPDQTAPAQLLDALVKELVPQRESAGEEAGTPEQDIAGEAADGFLYEKLEAIVRGGVQDAVRAVLMLAISELSEVDARTVRSGEWQENDIPSRPEGFGYVDEAPLAVSKIPYRFLCRGGGALKPGERIRTVRIAAKAGRSGKFATVELWPDGASSPVLTQKLAPGEYRYCSAVGDRIICFLPSLCVSDDLCAFRAGYSGQTIRVKPQNGEEWELREDGITSMSAGSGGRGMLFVQNGRLNFAFFRDAEDSFSRFVLESITKPAVEVRVTEGGFEVLLEDGTTAAGGDVLPRTGVLSLSGGGQGFGLKVLGEKDAGECALSLSGRSAAVLSGGGRCRAAFGGGFTLENTEGGGKGIRFT